MAETTYNLKLIIEAVNRTDAVLKEVGTKIQALDVQARRGGEVVSQAGAAVREKFAQVGQGVEQARNVVQHGAAAMASATQEAGDKMTGPIDRMRTGFKNLQGELAMLPFGIGAMASSFIGAYAAMASIDFIIRKETSTATEALQKFSDLRLVGLQLEAALTNSLTRILK